MRLLIEEDEVGCGSPALAILDREVVIVRGRKGLPPGVEPPACREHTTGRGLERRPHTHGLAEHAAGIFSVDPVDVDDPAAREHCGEDCRFGAVAQLDQVGRDRTAGWKARKVPLGEPNELRPEPVAQRCRILLDEAGDRERAEKPVHRRQREARPLCQVGELLVRRPFAEEIEKERRVSDRSERPARGLRELVGIHGRHLGSLPAAFG